MRKYFKVIGDISKLSKNLILLLAAVFISNVGNGIQVIAINKWIYDKTNSAALIGGVVILDYVISFLVQFMAGTMIDRGNPKKIYLLCDLLRAVIFFALSISMLRSDMPVLLVSVCVALISFITTVYRSCFFKLIPMLVQDQSDLLKVNGLNSTLMQFGLLLGTVIVAPIIELFGTSVAIMLNGLTFLLSAMIVMFIKLNYVKEAGLRYNSINVFKDWAEIMGLLRRDKTLKWHIVISSADILAVNFFNILLVPMVSAWYLDSTYKVSLFDSTFTVGAIVVGIVVGKVKDRFGIKTSGWIGIMVQGFVYFALCVCRITPFAVVIIFTMGFFNGYSGLIYQTTLQNRISHEVKGRISSFKGFVISIISIILIPVMTFCLDRSIICGLLCSGSIIMIFGVIAFALNVKRGEGYLIADRECQTK